MTRAVVIVVLSLLATLAAAQMSSLVKVTHIQGCLHAATNGYTLTAGDSGTVYSLSGKNENLRRQAEHMVELSGELLSPAPAASAKTNPVFRVAGVSALNESCAAGDLASNSDNVPTDPRTQAQASQALPLVGLLGLGSLVAGFLVRR